MKNLMNVCLISFLTLITACELPSDSSDSALKSGATSGKMYLLTDGYMQNPATYRQLERAFPEYQRMECAHVDCLIQTSNNLPGAIQYWGPENLTANDIVLISVGYYDVIFQAQGFNSDERLVSPTEYGENLIAAFELLKDSPAKIVFINIVDMPESILWPDAINLAVDYNVVNEQVTSEMEVNAINLYTFSQDSLTSDLRIPTQAQFKEAGWEQIADMFRSEIDLMN